MRASDCAATGYLRGREIDKDYMETSGKMVKMFREKAKMFREKAKLFKEKAKPSREKVRCSREKVNCQEKQLTTHAIF